MRQINISYIRAVYFNLAPHAISRFRGTIGRNFLQQDKPSTKTTTMICKIPFQIVEIPSRGYHIICSALLSGYTFNMLIDTGASLTAFDLGRIRQVLPESKISPYKSNFTGIGNARAEIYETFIPEINLKGLKIKNRKVLLLGLESINQAYAAYDLYRLDGVIGGDWLIEFNAIIDYKTQTLQLER